MIGVLKRRIGDYEEALKLYRKNLAFHFPDEIPRMFCQHVQPNEKLPSFYLVIVLPVTLKGKTNVMNFTSLLFILYTVCNLQ